MGPAPPAEPGDRIVLSDARTGEVISDGPRHRTRAADHLARLTMLHGHRDLVISLVRARQVIWYRLRDATPTVGVH